MDSPFYRINLTIQDQGKISLSPISSLFTLKEEIRSSFFSDDTSQLNVYKNGHILQEDTKALVQLGLQNDDVLSVKPGLLGGDDDNTWFIWLLYYLIIPVFLIFLMSGLLPLVASVFNIILTLALKFIGEKLRILDKIPGWIKKIGSFLLSVIQTFFIFFFVWAVCSFMIFPHLYGRQSRKCEAGLASKQVGKWCMYVFLGIYFVINIPDIFLNILNGLTEDTGLIVQASTGPLLSSLKEMVDVSKYVPYYAIPILGQILMVIHSGIDGILSFLFMFLDDLSQFNCDDTASVSQINDLLKVILSTADPSFKKSSSADANPMLRQIVKSRMEKMKAGKSSFGLKTKDAAHNKYVEELASKHSSPSNATTKLMVANMNRYVKDFKLEPTFKIIHVGMELYLAKVNYAKEKKVPL